MNTDLKIGDVVIIKSKPNYMGSTHSISQWNRYLGEEATVIGSVKGPYIQIKMYDGIVLWPSLCQLELKQDNKLSDTKFKVGDRVFAKGNGYAVEQGNKSEYIDNEYGEIITVGRGYLRGLYVVQFYPARKL